MARKDERHIDDILREIGGAEAEIGSNDDGSFIAPDGTLWMPARRRGWFYPIGKVQNWIQSKQTGDPK